MVASTRWDRVYRSDGLVQLTAPDLDVIADLGIKLVVDFRVDREVDENPSRLPDRPELPPSAAAHRRRRGGGQVDARARSVPAT